MNTQIDLFSAPFYNTIGLTTPELQKSVKKALKQETRVYDIFVRYGIPLTPIQVHELFMEKHGFILRDSIKRAITNLTKDGKLIKTDQMRMEKYGSKNHLWVLNTCIL